VDLVNNEHSRLSNGGDIMKEFLGLLLACAIAGFAGTMLADYYPAPVGIPAYYSDLPL
jgi:hypothetical protein